LVCKERNLAIEMLDESNMLSVQDIQKNCNEPVWTSSSLFHLLSKGSGYGYILKYLDKSIGYILLRSLNDEEEVLSLGVLKLNRRQGFASKLFYKFERAVIRKNVQRIFLEVKVENYAAICFYEFLGLKKIKVLKDYYKTDKGYEDGLLLSKVYF
jgi:ribosomal-protein-alanine N-acetyltransferase